MPLPKPNVQPVPTRQPVRDESFRETIRTIVLAMIIALGIRTLAFEPFNIPSSSMVPTLLIGDFLFVSKYSYGYGSNGTFWGLAPFEGRILGHAPARGDVVVFKTPQDNSTDFIKRLIGLPGDTIQMKQGILYINGLPVERDRLSELTSPDDSPDHDAIDYIEHLPGGVNHIIRKLGADDHALDNTPMIVVPPHSYFMMGDNRDNSQDGRVFGPVNEGNLVGHARFLFFSLADGTRFWEVWKWPGSVRWNRLFTVIH